MAEVFGPARLTFGAVAAVPTAEKADELRAALLKAAASNDAQAAPSDQFGDRYVLEFEIERPQGRGIVRSTWIVRRGERAPRLTSCFVK